MKLTLLIITVRDFQATPRSHFLFGSINTPTLVFQPVPLVWRSRRVFAPASVG
jgi:hypothetical protein